MRSNIQKNADGEAAWSEHVIGVVWSWFLGAVGGWQIMQYFFGYKLFSAKMAESVDLSSIYKC